MKKEKKQYGVDQGEDTSNSHHKPFPPHIKDAIQTTKDDLSKLTMISNLLQMKQIQQLWSFIILRSVLLKTEKTHQSMVIRTCFNNSSQQEMKELKKFSDLEEKVSIKIVS